MIKQSHQLPTDSVGDFEEIKQWQASVVTILGGQEFKAVRDFARDFAVNGIDGKKRITQIDSAPENASITQNV